MVALSITSGLYLLLWVKWCVLIGYSVFADLIGSSFPYPLFSYNKPCFGGFGVILTRSPVGMGAPRSRLSAFRRSFSFYAVVLLCWSLC